MIFAPPVTTVFVLGVLWKRGTKQAAMTTLYLGTIIGAVYFVMDMPTVGRFLLGGGRTHEDFSGLITDPVQGLGIPFMLVGALIALFCAAIYLVVSLLTPAMDEQRVSQVCWNHPLAFLSGKLTGASDPRVMALLLLGTVSVLYYLFK
jgi:SSS family solute:Na+ symporter